MEIGLVSQIIVALLYTGMALSVTCLLIQIFLYIVLPSSRKLDQKILTQLTIARMLCIVFEFTSLFQIESKVLTSVVMMMYFYTDAAVVGWMSVFTKRLYERLVIVFTQEKSFICISVTVWLLTLPFGVISCILMLVDSHYIYTYCFTYCTIKCVVLAVNLLAFCRIIQVVITSSKRDRDFKKTLKTCINSFLLLSITSLQVFIRIFYTDQTPLFVPTSDDFRNSFLIVFGLINCYQVVAITLIFIMILVSASKTDQPIREKIALRLKHMA